MSDEADVGLVDAHSEGDRRDDDDALAAHERVLRVAALPAAQAGVVGAGVHAARAQPLRRLLDPAARQAVDDAGVSPVLVVEEPRELLARTLLRHDPVADVRAVEAGDEHAGFLQAQPLPDLPPRGLVGGRGEGDAGHGRKALVKRRELQVLRAEVVTPLRHAVRFVDREQRELDLVEQRERPLAEQPLWGHVEQVDPAGTQSRLDVEHLLVRERGVEAGRPHAGLQQRVDLVAHQRDERRDDHGGAGAHERRDLIAERLAAARRHQHQAVAARDRVLDDRFLLSAEPVVAEDAAEQLASRAGHPIIVLRGPGERLRCSARRVAVRVCTNGRGRRSRDFG